MDLDELNDNYLNTLLDKISKENKSVFLLGDFNVDLLKYDKHAPTNEFLDFLLICFYHILSTQLESVLLPKPLLIIFSQIFILHALPQVIHLINFRSSSQFLIVPDIFLKFVTTQV